MCRAIWLRPHARRRSEVRPAQAVSTCPFVIVWPKSNRSQPMELRSIQYFVQVADEGSITRTADKIGIAQPALTRHIKQLEAELGTQLLIRLPRGVRLTTSGRDFLDHARA